MIKFLRLPCFVLLFFLLASFALAAPQHRQAKHTTVHHAIHHRMMLMYSMRHRHHRMRRHMRHWRWHHHLAGNHHGLRVWHHRWGSGRMNKGQRQEMMITLSDHHMPVLFRMRGNRWRTIVVGPRIASPDTAAYVSEHNTDHLNEFGIGKVLVADLMRFTEPSAVFDHIEPWTHGLSGTVRLGWSKDDALKEGRFVSETTHMLLRSYKDEAPHPE